MYGMTGKLVTQPGQRQALVDILISAAEVVSNLPGCRMYAVAADAADPDGVWVVEVWDNKNAHDQSLKNEDVRALIAQGRALITATDGAELTFMGGFGLPGVR